MKTSNHTLVAALVFGTLAMVGCGSQVTVEGNECGDEPPQPGGLCEDIYDCVDGEWKLVGTSCEEPPVCPDVRPEDGTACEMIGQTCDYTEEAPCGPIETITAECTHTGWFSVWPYCVAPNECPIDMPVAGTDCTGFDYSYCSYQVSCDGTSQSWTSLSCDYTDTGMQWNVTQLATCSDCQQLDPASCAATSECQWLTPGCGETQPPLPEGCYPVADCQATGCDAGGICTDFTYDPCANKGCDACGATYSACTFPPDSP
ncbi:MAG: hypothetical protein U0271_43195 [Polyangiaceae bacterium]